MLQTNLGAPVRAVDRCSLARGVNSANVTGHTCSLGSIAVKFPLPAYKYICVGVQVRRYLLGSYIYSLSHRNRAVMWKLETLHEKRQRCTLRPSFMIWALLSDAERLSSLPSQLPEHCPTLVIQRVGREFIPCTSGRLIYEVIWRELLNQGWYD